MLGEALSLGSAISWSVAVVLFRRVFSGDTPVSPFALNLFKNAVAILLMSGTLLILGEPVNMDRSAEDWARLIASGVLGIGISDLFFFHALRRLGAGRLTVVECAYAPSVALFGVLLLGEIPTLGDALGAALVAAGMLVMASGRPKQVAQTGPGGGDASPVIGALLGLGAMLTVAAAIIVAKPAFESGGLVEVALIRLISGAGALLLLTLPSRSRRAELAVLRPSPAWRAMIPAAVLGSWLSMLLWVGGFKYTDAATAAVLNQTTTVFTLLLARIMLGEPLTGRRIAAVLLGFSGALCVLLLRGGP
jgi:drug/metabolite transporter (DMT)-like permease